MPLPTHIPFKHRSGFSLVELICTIALIGVLLAIISPSFVGQQRQQDALLTEAKEQAISLAKEEFSYTATAAEITAFNGATEAQRYLTLRPFLAQAEPTFAEYQINGAPGIGPIAQP